MENVESRIVIFSSLKGGSGASFITNCISGYYSINTNMNIVLLDLNSTKKDSRIIFNIDDDMARDLGDINDITGKIGPDILNKLVINFENSFNLILPSLKYEKVQKLTKKKIENILDSLQKYYDIICIDLPYYLFINRKIDLLEYASKIVLVSSPDLISIKNTELFINEVLINCSPFDIDILVNRFNARSAISPIRLSGIIKHPIKAFIPYDRDIEFLYQSKGPSSIFKYNLRITKAITTFADGLLKDIF